MSNFRTTLQIEEAVNKIDLAEKIISLGSCFANNIGDKLADYKFNILKNPFGTIFNPIAIFDAMQLALGEKRLSDDLFVTHDDVFLHYNFHSDILGNTKDELQTIISDKLLLCGDWLRSSSVLFLTFGSAFIYRLRGNGASVANCHKQPAALFSKELLSVDAIVTAFEKVQHFLPREMKIILTVSPVRHIKDQLTLNSLSKSTLILAVHEMVKRYDKVTYFPAFELLLDDLRDYRFYQDDLVHPNALAVRYIWEAFAKCHISNDARSFMRHWEKIRRSLLHRPRNPRSYSNRKFLEHLLLELEALSEVDTTREEEGIREKLALIP